MRKIHWPTFLCAVAVTLLVVFFILPTAPTTSAPQKESAFDRVLRTGVLRCGYAPWAPFLVKDPNTGQLSGPNYEYVETLGRHLGVRIEWVLETGWGNFTQDLNTGKFDMMCATAWPDSHKIQQATPSIPLYYSPVYLVVRADDHRFDHDTRAMNSRDITFSAIEGDTSLIIAREDFPNARLLTLPQSADAAELLLNVANGKADVTTADFGLFEAANLKELRRLDTGHPVRVYGEILFVPAGETRFKDALDAAITTLTNSGVARNILVKYKDTTSTFPPARPYEGTF